MEPAPIRRRRGKTSPTDGRSPELARQAARSRWGAPRRVRLDRGLTDAERWAVFELVEALVAAKAVAS